VGGARQGLQDNLASCVGFRFEGGAVVIDL